MVFEPAQQPQVNSSKELSVSEMVAERVDLAEQSTFKKLMDSVSEQLDLLKEARGPNYAYIMMLLAKIRNKEQNMDGMAYMGRLESVLKEIRQSGPMSERIIINNNLKELNDMYKKLLIEQSEPLTIMDGFIDEQRAIVEANVQREKGLPEDEELYKPTRIWQKDINVVKDEYNSGVLEADYRLGMLYLLKHLYLHDKSYNNSPFKSFEGNESQYTSFLLDDLTSISNRVTRLGEIFDEELKGNPQFCTILGLEEAMITSVEYKRVLGKDFWYGVQAPSVPPIADLVTVANQLLRISMLLSQFEKSIGIDYLDKKVRSEAQLRLERNHSRDDILNQMPSDSKNQGYYYQLAIAKQRGLITDKNLLAGLPLRTCEPREALALMQFAMRNRKALSVFPELSGPGTYQVLTNIKRIPEEFFYESYTKIDRSKRPDLKYLGKLPARYAKEFFYLLMKNIERNKRHACISYSYNDQSGLYSLYQLPDRAVEELGVADELDELSDVFRFAELEGFEMTSLVISFMYQFLEFESRNDMIPLLEDLKQQNVDFYITPIKGESKTKIYFPAVCEKIVHKISSKYEFLENGKHEYYGSGDLNSTALELRTKFLNDIWSDRKEEEVAPTREVE